MNNFSNGANRTVLRSGVLFPEERESVAAREAAVGKGEKKEKVLFSPFSRPPTLALRKKNARSQVNRTDGDEGN